jgi:hypothetical protein
MSGRIASSLSSAVPLDRPSREFALERDGETVARRERHRGRRRVSQPARVQDSAVGQVVGNIACRKDFGLGQKPRMAGSEKAPKPFGSSDHAALDEWPDRFQSESRRADEAVNFALRNEQEADTRGRDRGQFTQGLRPFVRHESAFVDAVDQFGGHASNLAVKTARALTDSYF